MNWIDIKDQQPKEKQPILAACGMIGDMIFEIGVAEFEDGKWVCNSGEWKIAIEFWISEEELESAIP